MSELYITCWKSLCQLLFLFWRNLCSLLNVHFSLFLPSIVSLYQLILIKAVLFQYFIYFKILGGVRDNYRPGTHIHNLGLTFFFYEEQFFAQPETRIPVNSVVGRILTLCSKIRLFHGVGRTLTSVLYRCLYILYQS